MTLNRKPAGAIRPTTLNTSLAGGRNGTSSPPATSPLASSRGPPISNGSINGRAVTRNPMRAPLLSPLSTPGTTKRSLLLSPTSTSVIGKGSTLFSPTSPPSTAIGSPFLSPASTPGTPPHVRSPTVTRNGFPSKDASFTQTSDKTRKSSVVMKQKDAPNHKDPVSLTRKPSSVSQAKVSSPTPRRISKSNDSDLTSKIEYCGNLKEPKTSKLGVVVQKRKQSNGSALVSNKCKRTSTGRMMKDCNGDHSTNFKVPNGVDNGEETPNDNKTQTLLFNERQKGNVRRNSLDTGKESTTESNNSVATNKSKKPFSKKRSRGTMGKEEKVTISDDDGSGNQLAKVQKREGKHNSINSLLDGVSDRSSSIIDLHLVDTACCESSDFNSINTEAFGAPSLDEVALERTCFGIESAPKQNRNCTVQLIVHETIDAREDDILECNGSMALMNITSSTATTCSPTNPEGGELSTFDELELAWDFDRSQFMIQTSQSSEDSLLPQAPQLDKIGREATLLCSTPAPKISDLCGLGGGGESEIEPSAKVTASDGRELSWEAGNVTVKTTHAIDNDEEGDSPENTKVRDRREIITSNAFESSKPSRANDLEEIHSEFIRCNSLEVDSSCSDELIERVVQMSLAEVTGSAAPVVAEAEHTRRDSADPPLDQSPRHRIQPKEPVQQGTLVAGGLKIDDIAAVRCAYLEGGDSAVTAVTKPADEGLPGGEVVDGCVVDGSAQKQIQFEGNSDQLDSNTCSEKNTKLITPVHEVSSSESQSSESTSCAKVKTRFQTAVEFEERDTNDSSGYVMDEVKEPQSVFSEQQMGKQTAECAATTRVAAEDLQLMIPLEEKESERTIIDDGSSCIQVQLSHCQENCETLPYTDANANFGPPTRIPPLNDIYQSDRVDNKNSNTIVEHRTELEIEGIILLEVATTQDHQTALPSDLKRESNLDGGPSSLSSSSTASKTLGPGCALPVLSGQPQSRCCGAEPGTPRSLEGGHHHDNGIAAPGPGYRTMTTSCDPNFRVWGIGTDTVFAGDVAALGNNVANVGAVDSNTGTNNVGEGDTAALVIAENIYAAAEDDVQSEDNFGLEADDIIDDILMKPVDADDNICIGGGAADLESPVTAVDNNRAGVIALHDKDNSSVTERAAAQEDAIRVREQVSNDASVGNTETDCRDSEQPTDAGGVQDERAHSSAVCESLGKNESTKIVETVDGIDCVMVDFGVPASLSSNTTLNNSVADSYLNIQTSTTDGPVEILSEISLPLTKNNSVTAIAGSGGRREKSVRQQRSRLQRQGSAEAEQPRRKTSTVLVKSKSTSTLRITPPIGLNARPESVTESSEEIISGVNVVAGRRVSGSNVQAVGPPPQRQVKRKLTPSDTGDKKRTAPGGARITGSTVSNGGRGSEVPSAAAGSAGPPSVRGAASSTPQTGASRTRTAGGQGDKSGGSSVRSSRADAHKTAQPCTRRPVATTTRSAEPVKTTRVSKGIPGALSAADAAELKRLEAEVSAKSSEAEQAKREAEEARCEATHTGRGLEALTVLVHHLTHQYEAFSNPVLKAEIARLQACLQEAERALGESRVALEAAETRLSEERASAALQQNQLEEQHGVTLQRLQEEQQHQLQQIKDQHLKDLEDLAKKHQGDTVAEQELHRAEVVRLDAEHERKLSEVCRVHGEEQQALRRDLLELGDDQHPQISEVLASHAAREQELQARSTSLQKEHDKLKEQSKKLQDSLLSDTDHRVTALKNYCTGLQQEVDSLKSVVEMRNSELHKLRAQVSGMEQLQRDLDAARQCANTLQAKTEDLNAQMDAKAKAERQLLSSNRQLLENMNRESTLNKQLRLENEELQWKLRQREQLSTSLPMATLDLMTRVCHLNTSWEERPASLHHQQHPLRERQHSAALSKGTTRADGRLVTCSPQDERSKQQQKDQAPHDKLKAQRTGDGDSPPSSPCVKAVVEKSNSVSFILDLNDSLSDDSYLEFPASPRLKHGTPTFSRKAVQKSRSSSLDKKIGGQIGKNIALAKCTSAGNFFGKGPHSELEPIQDCKPESIKENGSFLSDNQMHERSRRLHSTSESSGGADSETLESSIERVSPSGLAWTVPMNGSSPSSPRSPCHSSSRDNFPGIGLRHLHQPEEDEYEENLEDSEDAFINGIHPDITPLVNLMNTSSSSPSDSELSRCGSQAGLTSESDEESSLAEGDRPAGSLSPEGVWLSQGAGEAMVPSELVVQCGGSNSSTDSTDISTKDTPTKDVQTKVALAQLASSASFYNGEGTPQGRLEEEQLVV